LLAIARAEAAKQADEEASSTTVDARSDERVDR